MKNKEYKSEAGVRSSTKLETIAKEAKMDNYTLLEKMSGNTNNHTNSNIISKNNATQDDTEKETNEEHKINSDQIQQIQCSETDQLVRTEETKELSEIASKKQT